MAQQEAEFAQTSLQPCFNELIAIWLSFELLRGYRSPVSHCTDMALLLPRL